MPSTSTVPRRERVPLALVVGPTKVCGLDRWLRQQLVLQLRADPGGGQRPSELARHRFGGAALRGVQGLGEREPGLQAARHQLQGVREVVGEPVGAAVLTPAQVERGAGPAQQRGVQEGVVQPVAGGQHHDVVRSALAVGEDHAVAIEYHFAHIGRATFRRHRPEHISQILRPESRCRNKLFKICRDGISAALRIHGATALGL